jgi:hypothetical protein
MWLALSSDPEERATTVSALGAQTLKVIGSRYAADRPQAVSAVKKANGSYREDS